jgi:hypothetical protein
MSWKEIKSYLKNKFRRNTKMAKVKITRVYEFKKPLVICDTNVWYHIVDGSFNKPDDVLLIPTSFSLEEIATSKLMVHNTKYYQDVLRSIYDNCGPIIPNNPFDFVLNNLDNNYELNDENTEQLLKGFSELLSRKVEDVEIDEELKNKIIKDCEESRKPTFEFAHFGNEEIFAIRKNINTGIGIKEHIKEDSTEINRQMLIVMFNTYADIKKYTINWSNFDWNQIELFMTVTEIYFKKLETTKGMKINANDLVDWFNLLYVTPTDKYLTFEDRWRNYIVNDERIKHYIYS